MLMEEIEKRTEDTIRERFVGLTRARGIIPIEKIIIATACEVTLTTDIFAGGAIRAIMIVEIEVIPGRVIIVVEVIRGIDLIIGREAIRHIHIGEIETIEEVEVEIGVEVTSETHTRQCQRK
jgi:hypothetical protein